MRDASTAGGPSADRESTSAPLRSALYEGMVRHRRLSPVEHAFSYRVVLAAFDLDEIDEVCARHPLWSNESPNAVSFRRGDFLPDRSGTLAQAVRDIVHDQVAGEVSGPIVLLTQPRTWGWLFNPISYYFCYDPTGVAVEYVVVEVTNTPWHERTTYVLPGAGEHTSAKQLHVSPFLPMDLTHHFSIGTPGSRLTLAIDDFRGDELVFQASLALTRLPITTATLSRLLWRYPMMTVRVSSAIYFQALRLKLKGARFYPHPTRTTPPSVGTTERDHAA